MLLPIENPNDMFEGSCASSDSANEGKVGYPFCITSDS
jgi:hypothetical protein